MGASGLKEEFAIIYSRLLWLNDPYGLYSFHAISKAERKSMILKGEAFDYDDRAERANGSKQPLAGLIRTIRR
jgi:hypothetical protein